MNINYIISKGSYILFLLIASFLLLFQAGAYAATGDLTISRQAGPWPIKIRTCSHDAGAICSLTWRNREFIDDFDHGRQIQSASTFDGREEGFNPTEAGALADGHNPRPSSSRLLAIRKDSSRQLSTQSKMAYWLPVNGQKTSNHIHSKRVTIGALGLAHVVEYATSFKLPANEPHSSAKFEIVTGYMPGRVFSRYWTYDVTRRILRPISAGPGEQRLPVIISTADKGWAMGIYSPREKSFGRFRFPDQGGISKWNNVARVNSPRTGGVYSYKSYIVVGSLDNVRVSMDQLYRKLGR